MDKHERPKIIKKAHHEEHDEHHGGSWKVAYADFVTAMMAFFLLLWILNAVNEKTLKGIAEYFTPTVSSDKPIGGKGLLDGMAIGRKGVLSSSDSPQYTVATPVFDEANDSEIIRMKPEVAEAAIKARDDKRFADLSEKIDKAIKDNDELRTMAENVKIDRVPEGLRIQIVDQANFSMFQIGSAKPLDKTRKLIALIAQAVAPLPNEVTITGHTDARPYANADGYSNWELSTDRANAARRILAENGVKADRLDRVSGVADKEPLDEKDPLNAVNRRISFVLLYDKPKLDVLSIKPQE
jgi:chemotaxis protein MotB